jgi:regulation of enolase protein 1 (concanavalin A-like superfamily)
MNTDRRTFLVQSFGLSLSAAVALPSFAGVPGASQVKAGDLFSQMQWLNEPASATQSNGKLVVRSKSKTDFWRKTLYGYVTDNGHFFHLPVMGEFTFVARVNGAYAALYDQAGLMVRLDAQNWMKCGTELFDGQRHASVVFTREFSDWSTMPDLSSTAPVWWRTVRKKDSLEAHCSLDGKVFTTVRQGYFPSKVRVDVGVMCAAPEGPGFEAVFDELQIEISGEAK